MAVQAFRRTPEYLPTQRELNVMYHRDITTTTTHDKFPLSEALTGAGTTKSLMTRDINGPIHLHGQESPAM